MSTTLLKYGSPRAGILSLVLALATVPVLSTSTRAAAVSNPTPVVTTVRGETILTMDLNGFGNYGVVDHASDILYTNENNGWVFPLPGNLRLENFSRGYIRAFLSLDDHPTPPSTAYNFAVATNGTFVFSGSGAVLNHGTVGSDPQAFSNWMMIDYPIGQLNESFQTFYLANTSQGTGSGDWIGIDRLELHLVQVPEPGSLLLAATGLLGLALRRTQTGIMGR